VQPLDHLIDHLRSRDIALDGEERPAAIVWTDPKAEWKALIGLAQTRLEELLVLGEFDPGRRSGPAIWLRCLVDGALDEPPLPSDRIPILYLPGVARQDLRAGEDCLEELRPLVELMFRGTMWLQHNGKDWTVNAFLSSKKTLGLDIAGDKATAEALLRALPEVAMTPLTQLGGRRLEAEDFDRMLSDDVNRDLLRWMGDAEGTRARLGDSGWGAFCSRCRDELGFDPETEADVIAGERLGRREGVWERVWARFSEAPSGFPGVTGVLRRSRPTDSIPFDRETWPDLNDEDEETVREALAGLHDLAHLEACDVVEGLEKKHGLRRSWVWARLGLSPMAEVLAPLSMLAKAVRSTIGGSSLEAMAAHYQDGGWQADAAAWRAIAMCSSSDEALIENVIRHLLEPWLEDSARAFQKTLEQDVLPTQGVQAKVGVDEGGCLLFSDGLRYDLGNILVERLEGRGCRVVIGQRWAAAPTVTATAKPAVTPVADHIVGTTLEKDFAPSIEKGGKVANAANLRKAIEGRGYQILGEGMLDFPVSEDARGWVEFGSIDTLGHKLMGRLAGQLNEEIERLAERIIRLLDTGWKSVRVVTDHGWLLLPGGLPKADLPKHLTESRWARCAVLSGQSSPDVPRFPWYWNTAQDFATAPGISCFNKSDEYAHGGLSIQECLIPDILVERGGGLEARATITSITWRRMRCFVEAGAQGEVVADLRLDKPTGASVVATSKRVEDGAVSLLLEGDEHEEAQLVLVLLDENGNVLAHKPTRVGEDS
jgi:hypothetical protein